MFSNNPYLTKIYKIFYESGCLSLRTKIKAMFSGATRMIPTATAYSVVRTTKVTKEIRNVPIICFRKRSIMHSLHLLETL